MDQQYNRLTGGQRESLYYLVISHAETDYELYCELALSTRMK